jgi:hypothetical protein
MTRVRAIFRGLFGRIPAIERGDARTSSSWQWPVVLGSVLREIFDESAYARFLERRQIQTSPQAYAEFLRENEVSRQRRPRCC